MCSLSQRWRSCRKLSIIMSTSFSQDQHGLMQNCHCLYHRCAFCKPLCTSVDFLMNGHSHVFWTYGDLTVQPTPREMVLGHHWYLLQGINRIWPYSQPTSCSNSCGYCTCSNYTTTFPMTKGWSCPPHSTTTTWIQPFNTRMKWFIAHCQNLLNCDKWHSSCFWHDSSTNE